jgi:hypothetical protein
MKKLVCFRGEGGSSLPRRGGRGGVRDKERGRGTG